MATLLCHLPGEPSKEVVVTETSCENGSMDLADVVCQRPEVTVRHTASGAILVNLGTGQCWQLNRIGAEVLEQIRTERTIGEVCEALGSRYQVTRDVLERDVCRLTEELLEAGLIDRSGRSTDGPPARRSP